MANIDPRVKRMAAMTLVSILDEDENKLFMLREGSLPRLVSMMRKNDSQLRKCAIDCMQRITKLGDIAPQPLKEFAMVRSDTVLHVLLDTFTVENDADAIMGMLRAIMNLVGLQKDGALEIKARLVDQGAIPCMLAHADRLHHARSATQAMIDTLQQLVRTVGSLTKTEVALRQIVDCGYVSTVLELCKSSVRKTRRGAARLLTRMIALDEAKIAVMEEEGALALLLSTGKVHDEFVQATGSRIVCELAGAPVNRAKMIKEGVLDSILSMLRTGSVETQVECMRAMADLAEAIENRRPLAYRGLDAVVEAGVLVSEQEMLQEHAVRFICNLLAPAGCVTRVTCSPMDVGRYGSTLRLAVTPSSTAEAEEEEGEEGVEHFPPAPLHIADLPGASNERDEGQQSREQTPLAGYSETGTPLYPVVEDTVEEEPSLEELNAKLMEVGAEQVADEAAAESEMGASSNPQVAPTHSDDTPEGVKVARRNGGPQELQPPETAPHPETEPELQQRSESPRSSSPHSPRSPRSASTARSDSPRSDATSEASAQTTSSEEEGAMTSAAKQERARAKARAKAAKAAKSTEDVKTGRRGRSGKLGTRPSSTELTLGGRLSRMTKKRVKKRADRKLTINTPGWFVESSEGREFAKAYNGTELDYILTRVAETDALMQLLSPELVMGDDAVEMAQEALRYAAQLSNAKYLDVQVRMWISGPRVVLHSNPPSSQT
jgi:hypothetical protein